MTMRQPLFLTFALAALTTACSPVPGGRDPQYGSDTPRQQAAGTLASPQSASTPAPIASAPDHGELLRYPSQYVGRGAASLAHIPVAISEDHALAAIGRKALVLDAPDGVRSRIAYARHEDHGDGNWTWVGRGSDGGSALLTFGQNAVFGSIQRADGSELRIVTRQRRTYAVVVRPNQLRGVETSIGSDALLAPETTVQALSLASEGAQADRASASASAAAAANEIDVLLGYSTGLAQRIGSASGAETRMQNLVAITNQGYQNSGVVYRARLVGTVQVAYSDSTRNDTTLHALTGSTGSGSAPIDPAFNQLRALREQTGADVVSFVRQFREPEQDGCGIAWLLGGQRTTIDQADAPFAYSVVGDGSDVRESDGRTYFCRDETLAHELGHNMGQTHNAEDSRDTQGNLQYGVHTYSFGYRETTETGFYTIMAYRIPDSSQTAIRHFANPAVTFQARATGVVDVNDNVRSMNQTMPVIANFRGQVVPPSRRFFAPMDVNADGLSDIFLRGGTALAAWTMSGATRTGDLYLGDAGSASSFAGFGNFDNAGGTDLVWTDASQVKIWFNDGRSRYVVYPIAPFGNGWVPFGSGDINGDGKSDLLFRGGTHLAYWLMDGATRIADVYAGNGGVGARIVAVADFDNNGASDIVWADDTQIRLWMNNRNGTFTSVVVGSYGGGWQPVGAGDVTGDGNFDLVFAGASALAIWEMSGSQLVASRYAGDAGQGFRLFAIADYNGDSLADIGWQNGAQTRLWMNNGQGGFTAANGPSFVCCWRPEGGLLN
jgi:hypothetical protein